MVSLHYEYFSNKKTTGIFLFTAVIYFEQNTIGPFEWWTNDLELFNWFCSSLFICKSVLAEFFWSKWEDDKKLLSFKTNPYKTWV